VPQHALVGGFIEAQATVAARYQAGEALHHVTWMSGPSKTADIEQTLVIGAHGVCALAVLPLPIASAG
jgi:L-lactate dehydrogenase complex protein LldG